MNILEELFYGEINPYEKYYLGEGKYADYLQTVVTNERKLNAYLEGEEKELFRQLMDAHQEILVKECVERFKDGWRLAARIMLDTFVVPEKPLERQRDTGA